MHAQKSRKASKRRQRCWVLKVGAMGALLAFTVGNSRAVAIGYARHADAAVTSAQVQSQAQVIRFDIPAGTLEAVLNTFQSLTGLRVLIPNESMRGISSPGVSGAYTAEQALTKLLAGTGVTYSRTDSDTLTLEIQTTPESVEVVGRTSPLSSSKYTEPLRDIPQTVTVIPKDVIEKQGATTLRDVLRNVPGLTMTAGEGGAPAGDNLTLRGFSARNDIFVDGVRDLGPQSRDPFNLEQVEVVKGPGSAYTGRGSAGGTINLTSKAPGLTPSYGGTLVLGNAGMKRATADLNAPLARLGMSERTAFRLNLLAHDSGVAGRDVVEKERWGVGPFAGLRPRHADAPHAQLLPPSTGQRLRLRHPVGARDQQRARRVSRPPRARPARHLLRLPRPATGRSCAPTSPPSGSTASSTTICGSAISSATVARRATRWRRRRASPPTTRPSSTARCVRGSPRTTSGTTRPTCAPASRPAKSNTRSSPVLHSRASATSAGLRTAPNTHDHSAQPEPGRRLHRRDHAQPVRRRHHRQLAGALRLRHRARRREVGVQRRTALGSLRRSRRRRRDDQRDGRVHARCVSGAR